MTIESMTGFAREAGDVSGQAWAWEIRSVNGRGLDLRLRTPPGLEVIAEEARKRLTAAFGRGTLHVNLSITSPQGAALPRVNADALAALLASLDRIALPDGVAPLSLDGLLAVRGVVEIGEDAVDVVTLMGPALLDGLDRAILALRAARRAEGAALETVIRGQSDTIARLAGEAEAHPARGLEAIQAKLAQQVAALLQTGQGLDPQRLHQEAALIAVRADIREELDRLQAHVVALRELVGQGGAIGRKLDFLAQEFGREASTLCAKAGDPGLSRIGLDLRTVVDQLREQVQNVE